MMCLMMSLTMFASGHVDSMRIVTVNITRNSGRFKSEDEYAEKSIKPESRTYILL